MQVINSILRVVVHVLGPRKGIGATIVLLHREDENRFRAASNDNSILNTESALTFPWQADITDRAHQRVLINLMCRTDGATIVSAEGAICCMRSWLVPPQEEMRNIDPAAAQGICARRYFPSILRGSYS